MACAKQVLVRTVIQEGAPSAGEIQNPKNVRAFSAGRSSMRAPQARSILLGELKEPFETRTYSVDQEAEASSFAVGIDVSAVSLHPDDLSQNLRVRHRFRILLTPRVSAEKKRATSDKWQITGMVWRMFAAGWTRRGKFSFDDTHNTMGDDTSLLTVKDNITDTDRRWFDGLNRNDFILFDGGIHAPSGGTKADDFPLAKQLCAEVSEKVCGRMRYGTWGSRFGHGSIVTFIGEILQYRNGGIVELQKIGVLE
jgi:hypothetical protein